jgi:hypothetical protein
VKHTHRHSFDNDVGADDGRVILICIDEFLSQLSIADPGVIVLAV